MAHFGAQTPNGLAVQQLEVLVRPPSSSPPTRSCNGCSTSGRPRRCRLSTGARPAAQRTRRAWRSAVCLAPSGWSAITTTMRANNRGTTRPMPHWVGSGLHARVAPADLFWRGPMKRAIKRPNDTWPKPAPSKCRPGKSARVHGVGRYAQAWRSGKLNPVGVMRPYICQRRWHRCAMRPRSCRTAGKQPDGTAKTRQVYLGWFLRSIGRMKKPSGARTTNPPPMFPASIHRRVWPDAASGSPAPGLGSAGKSVVLDRWRHRLENMGKDCFKGCVQVVTFIRAGTRGRVLDAAGQKPSRAPRSGSTLGQAFAQRQGREP